MALWTIFRATGDISRNHDELLVLARHRNRQACRGGVLRTLAFVFGLFISAVGASGIFAPLLALGAFVAFACAPVRHEM
jgi:H+/Cl- antiporter ClcA